MQNRVEKTSYTLNNNNNSNTSSSVAHIHHLLAWMIYLFTMPLIYADQKEALTIIIYTIIECKWFFFFVCCMWENSLYSCLNCENKENPIAPARHKVKTGEIWGSLFNFRFTVSEFASFYSHSTKLQKKKKYCGKKSTSFQCLTAFNHTQPYSCDTSI